MYVEMGGTHLFRCPSRLALSSSECSFPSCLHSNCSLGLYVVVGDLNKPGSRVPDGSRKTKLEAPGGVSSRVRFERVRRITFAGGARERVSEETNTSISTVAIALVDWSLFKPRELPPAHQRERRVLKESTKQEERRALSTGEVMRLLARSRTNVCISREISE